MAQAARAPHGHRTGTATAWAPHGHRTDTARTPHGRRTGTAWAPHVHCMCTTVQLPRCPRCTLVRAAGVRHAQTALPTPQPGAPLEQADYKRDEETVHLCVRALRQHQHARRSRRSLGATSSAASRAQVKPLFLYCDVDYPHGPFWRDMPAAALAAVNRSALGAPPVPPLGEMHPYDAAMSLARGLHHPPPSAEAAAAFRLAHLAKLAQALARAPRARPAHGLRAPSHLHGQPLAPPYTHTHLAKLVQADTLIGTVLDAAAQLLRTTLVVLTSDHGKLRLERHAATLCVPSCNLMRPKLQLYASQTAALCVPGCSPVSPRLQPYASQARCGSSTPRGRKPLSTRPRAVWRCCCGRRAAPPTRAGARRACCA